MKLEKVRLRNFRGYKDETEVSISDLTAFIGKNDAGKSSVLEALEIFFNNSLVVCEREDLSVSSEDNKIEITCIFTDLPEEIVIDATNTTNLTSEHLLNNDGKLEIKKIFTASAAKPKENIYIVCNYPTIENGDDLLNLKITELRARADAVNVPRDNYNRAVSASIRSAIWGQLGELQNETTDLLIDKEDTKKVFDALKKYLPIYALFQSDRQSKDDDKEVVDPMKVAVQQALGELNDELEHIKNEVRTKAVDTANRTLEKLKEMSPELASELVPEFKTEPKFDSQFKLTIKSEEGIPINKRGSGVRRLILLNFFRAEAERLRGEQEGNQVIFAFEEPETSQHPDHQEMLVKAFLELAGTGNSQILLTTHTPSLGGLIPLQSLRFISSVDGIRTIESGTEEVFAKISETLGVLPEPIPKSAKAILLLEGKGDVAFVSHTASQLKSGGHITHTFEDKNIALVPIGGCGNLKHWKTLKLAEQFNIPYCVLLDSDLGTAEETKNRKAIAQIQADGIKAYLTRKREPENYISLDVLSLPAGSTFSFTDTCDAKVLIATEKGTRRQNVLEDYWTLMSAEQIRTAETYGDNGVDRYEFSEMFTDFYSLVTD